MLVEEFGQAFLDEGGLALGQDRDLRLVDVQTDHLVPEFRHARCVHGPQIATTNHRNPHGFDSSHAMTPGHAAGRENAP